jgi:signal transduction histidine kinase
MTRRVLASFLVVLVAMIAFVEIPLGIELARHERSDFRQTTLAKAQSIASAAEERLGDQDEQSTLRGLHVDIDSGDAAVVVNRAGTPVASFGPALPATAVQRAIAGQSISISDRTVVAVHVGAPAHDDGIVVLARSSESLDHRQSALALALVLAAIVALAIGAAVAVALARWIGQPVQGLRRVATAMGAGNLDARAVEQGPPEVRELAADLNVMADRISNLIDSQRAITSDVSHQLRTPLSALRLRLENMTAEAPDEMRTDLVATLEEINRLNRLADGLLAVARAEEHAPQPVPVTVSDVVTERLALWQPLAAERRVTLRERSEPVVVLAGEGHLEQVLDNVLANALDVVPAGSAIEVVVRDDGEFAEISVVDHGPGIPAESRAQAFQRFSGSRDRARSAGLGLAIVGSLVKIDHGTARLDETPGGGLTVTLRLPRRR